jgi:hypothetical protein
MVQQDLLEAPYYCIIGSFEIKILCGLLLGKSTDFKQPRMKRIDKHADEQGNNHKTARYFVNRS